MKRKKLSDARDAIVEGMWIFNLDAISNTAAIDDLIKQRAYHEVELKYDRRNFKILIKALKLLNKIE